MAMDAFKWFLSLAIYGAIIALCILRFDWAGIGGLAGSAIGFLLRVWGPDQDSISERVGNGYVGLLIGVCVGFVIGAIAQYAWPYFEAMR